MDLTKNKERIKNIIIDKGEIFRKELAKELNILPRNLNRDIDQLLSNNIIIKDKKGKEILYIAKTIETENDETVSLVNTVSGIQIPHLETSITKKMRVTKAQKVYEYLKAQGTEISSAVLREMFKIPPEKFAEYLRPMVKAGKIKWRKRMRETLYSSGETPVKEIPRRTRLDMVINLIPEMQTFKAYLLNRRYSNRTITEYLKHIDHLYRWKSDFNMTKAAVIKVANWTLKDIEGFRTYLRTNKNYADDALHGTMVALKAFFKAMKRLNLILEDIMKDEQLPSVSRNKQQPSVQIEDFFDMVKAIVKSKNNRYKIRNLALLLVMLETGARVGEIETICREHIDFQHKTLTILGEKMKFNDGKREERSMPISDLTLKYLKKAIEEKKDVKETIFYYIHDKKEEVGTAIFLTRHNIFLKSIQIRTIIQKLRSSLRSHKKITVHSFRRHILIDLVNGGMREDFASARVGQAPRNMNIVTFRYIEWTIEWKEEYERQYKQIHPLNQPDIIAKFNAIVEANQ